VLSSGIYFSAFLNRVSVKEKNNVPCILPGLKGKQSSASGMGIYVPVERKFMGINIGSLEGEGE